MRSSWVSFIVSIIRTGETRSKGLRNHTHVIVPPLRHTRTMSRTLHLVAIETLCADPDAPAAIVREVLDDYLANAHWQGGDLVVIASNPTLARRFVTTVADRYTDGALTPPRSGPS